jgi:hypothetical protein
MRAKINLKIEVRDKKTNELITSISQTGNSLTRNFLDMILGAITDTNRACKDLTGSTYTIRFSSEFNAGGLLGLVGIGVSPESIEDYTLTNYIKSYRTKDLVITSTTTGYKLSVSFDFEITTPITVTETGIYQKQYDTSGITREILLIRNLLASPINITENSILSVIYEIIWEV